MLKAIFQPKLNKFVNKFLNIPEEFKDELLMELLQLNIGREKILSLLLLALNIFLFCLNILTSKTSKGQVIFGGFSYLHFSMILVALVFLLICHFKKKIYVKDIVLFKTLHSLICLMVLILCSFIAVHNVEIGKQPFSYIIALFSIASLIFLSRVERIIVYIFPYVFYVVKIFNVQSSPYHKFEYIFFSALLISFALIILEINYSSYVKNFINNKVIFEKNQEINNLLKTTQENLKKRTEELNATVEYERLRTSFLQIYLMN